MDALCRKTTPVGFPEPVSHKRAIVSAPPRKQPTPVGTERQGLLAQIALSNAAKLPTGDEIRDQIVRSQSKGSCGFRVGMIRPVDALAGCPVPGPEALLSKLHFQRLSIGAEGGSNDLVGVPKWIAQRLAR
jgi:hypothetical protein